MARAYIHLALGLVAAAACAPPSGAYLCDSQGRCPEGYVCREGRCHVPDRDAGRLEPPAWVKAADSTLQDQSARGIDDGALQLSAVVVSTVNAAEVCAQPLEPEAWPGSDGVSLKVIARHDQGSGGFLASVVEDCRTLQSVEQIPLSAACAWLHQREGSAQSLVLARRGSVTRSGEGTPSWSLELDIEGESFHWQVDYIPCP